MHRPFDVAQRRASRTNARYRKGRGASGKIEKNLTHCGACRFFCAVEQAPSCQRRTTARTLSSGWQDHGQALTRLRQLLSERGTTRGPLGAICGLFQERGHAARGRKGDARRDEQRGATESSYWQERQRSNFQVQSTCSMIDVSASASRKSRNTNTSETGRSE